MNRHETRVAMAGNLASGGGMPGAAAVASPDGAARPARAGSPRGSDESAGPGRGWLPVLSCTGTASVVCQVDVPPGNYDVTVVLGDADESASTAVRAEARRMMLAEVATGPGEFVRRAFSVNVREPEGEPTKEGVGSPGLTLTFTGSAPRVQGVQVRPARRNTVLYLAGDSTVCDQDTLPYTGWGQAIPQHLRRGVTVANYAGSGEGSASFLADPRLFHTMRPLIRRGDIALIQFGHNDKRTPADEYRANLARLTSGVREQGGRPVLVSPPVRRAFSAGRLTSTALHVNGLGVDLPTEMEEVAREQGVPYINLTADSAALVETLGPEASKALYLYHEQRDDTHFSEHGADRIGRLVLDRLRELRLIP